MSRELAQGIADLLNDAYEMDPAAVHSLCANRVPCNEALANHPTIQVAKTPVTRESYIVGLVGVMNGLLGNDVAVAMVFTDAESPVMTGFTVVTID